MPVDAPVTTMISWISADIVMTALNLRWGRGKARREELGPPFKHLHGGLVHEQPIQCEEEDLGACFVAQDGGNAFLHDVAVERFALWVDALTSVEELAPVIRVAGLRDCRFAREDLSGARLAWVPAGQSTPSTMNTR